MQFLHAFLLNRSARRYASLLGRQLSLDYGACKEYTEAQIRSAVQRLKLSQQYIDIGFAAFMPQTVFEQVRSSGSDYGALRTLFQRYVRSQSTDTFEPAGENPYALSVDRSGHH